MKYLFIFWGLPMGVSCWGLGFGLSYYLHAIFRHAIYNPDGP